MNVKLAFYISRCWLLLFRTWSRAKSPSVFNFQLCLVRLYVLAPAFRRCIRLFVTGWIPHYRDRFIDKRTLLGSTQCTPTKPLKIVETFFRFYKLDEIRHQRTFLIFLLFLKPLYLPTDFGQESLRQRIWGINQDLEEIQINEIDCN